MIDKKNMLQAGYSSQPPSAQVQSAQPQSPEAKLRPFTTTAPLTIAIAKNRKVTTAIPFAVMPAHCIARALVTMLTRVPAPLLTIVLLPTAALVLLIAVPFSAQAQNCTKDYEPGAQTQRVSSGLFDGRVGPIKIVNNTENATVISLYHPEAPKRVFKYWYAEPGKSYLLGTDNYSSDWGIQVDEGPICIVGRVASWDGHTFTTFPSRLFIVDAANAAPPIAVAAPSLGAVTRTRSTAVALMPRFQPPSVYESIALKQLTDGEVRSSLISLLRAADLYRASGQTQEEKRVRDRIKQIRGS